ncbi:MAG: hypothetical protein QM270_09425 [Bacillota bacterium]|nr:hypothetical protein [Bacillota bacterium]
MTGGRKKRRLFADFEDDGRTIAPMDLDGMPERAGGSRLFDMPFRLPHGAARVRREEAESRRMAEREAAARGEAEWLYERRQRAAAPPSRRETISLILNAMLAGLAVASVYLIVFALFFLFVWFVWLRR